MTQSKQFTVRHRDGVRDAPGPPGLIHLQPSDHFTRMCHREKGSEYIEQISIRESVFMRIAYDCYSLLLESDF
jgi:hypothetical protein